MSRSDPSKAQRGARLDLDEVTPQSDGGGKGETGKSIAAEKREIPHVLDQQFLKGE